MDAKEGDAVWYFSNNSNSMSFRKIKNYKADRLKFLLQHDNIDLAGLKEVCINWSAFKSLDNLTYLLWYGQALLRSMASNNKNNTNNIGCTQQGGTDKIIGENCHPS